MLDATLPVKCPLACPCTARALRRVALSPFKSGIRVADRLDVAQRMRGRCDSDILAFVNLVRSARGLGRLPGSRTRGHSRGSFGLRPGSVNALQSGLANDDLRSEKRGGSGRGGRGMPRLGTLRRHPAVGDSDFAISFDWGRVGREASDGFASRVLP